MILWFYAVFMKKNQDSIRAVFAKNVKIYRNTLKFSQEKLAEKSRLSVQTIKDIEGARRWVSDTTLSRLAKAMSISEFQLLIPEKPPQKSNLKTLMSLKESLKDYLEDQFEKTLNKGNFS